MPASKRPPTGFASRSPAGGAHAGKLAKVQRPARANRAMPSRSLDEGSGVLWRRAARAQQTNRNRCKNWSSRALRLPRHQGWLLYRSPGVC